MYRDFHRACDSVYRDLHKSGVGTNVSHAKVITREEEDRLWDSGTFCIATPKGLQNAVFFYAGKHFCLRGGEEQRGLSPAQFIRTSNPDGYKYIEHGSKNRSGGLGLLNIENKCVPCVALPENRPRCLVFLLDLYLSKLPNFAFDKGIFYCRPKQNCPSQGSWYDAVAVGKNKLSSMLQEICEKAGIEKRSNHSLRATGATALFQSNAPSSLIQKTTGHRSEKALQLYEHTSIKQHRQLPR